MPTLLRLFAISSFLFLTTQPARSARACPVVTPDHEAIVSISLSNVGRADVLLQWYGNPTSGWCYAGLDLPIRSDHCLCRPSRDTTFLSPVEANFVY